MKKYLIFLILLIRSASAQITFEKTFEGIDAQSGFSVQQTYDGGYIVAGQNLNFPNNQLLLLIKTDSLGDTLWTRLFGGPTFDLWGLSVEQTFDSGFVVCGRHGDVNGNSLFLMKTDQYGNLIWTKRYSSPIELIGGSMKQTPDSGFILCGNTRSSSGTNQLFAIKTNSQGDTLWSRLYFSFYSEGYSVDVTKDHGFIISGQIVDEPIILKLDSTGNIVFLKHYNLIGHDTRIRSTSDGGYILTGASNPSSFNDALLIKTDSMGNILWTKLFDGPLSYNDWGNTIIETKDSAYVLTVESGSYVYPLFQLQIIKVDNIGNVHWSRIFDGTNSSGCFFDAGAHQTSDEGFIICGYRTSPTTNKNELYLIKTDSSGNTGCNVVNPIVIDSSLNCSTSSPTPSLSPFQVTVGSLLLTFTINQNAYTLCSSTNIIQNNLYDQHQLILFPNPASEYFEVNVKESRITSIEIFNIMGEKINALSFEAGTSLASIECTLYPEGIYIIVAEMTDGKIFNSRIAVVR